MENPGSMSARCAKLRGKVLIAATFPTIVICSGAAMAQSPSSSGTTQESATAPAAAEPSAATSENQLQEIVVTAQRRRQNLQDVPIAVTAFNAATLQATGVTNIESISHIDPSVNFGGSTGVVLPFLRGVGNPSATAIGNEASVPVYIDDVYYTRLSRTYLELASVERVEILKGPQGTLFGRNASGGAIQVFTRDPGDKPAFEAITGYSNFDTWSGKLYASAPLGDNGGIDFSASGRHQGEGWGRNVFNGNKTYQYNFVNLRSKLLYRLTDTTTVRMIGFYSKSFTEVGNTAGRYRGTFGSTPSPFYGTSQTFAPADGFYDTTNTKDPYQRTQGYGGSLKIDQELGFAQVTSITAYRKATETNVQDGENTPNNYALYSLHPVDRQISQELQLKSNVASKVSWIIGGFYLDSRQGFTPAKVTGDSVGPGAFVQLDGLQRVKSIAGFGQATYPISSMTQITLGARYTHDRVNGRGDTLFVIPDVVTVPLAAYGPKSFTFNKFTYRAAVDQQLADRVKVYGSISRGYKSGTFNTLPLGGDPSKPETVDAYEIGLKSEFFGRRLRFNAAVFQNDITNPQVQIVITDPISGLSNVALTNAKKARSKGLEFNADAVLAKSFSVRLGATYLDAKYTDFKDAPAYFPIVNGVCPAGSSNTDSSGQSYSAGLCTAVPLDASGNRLVQVPKWRLNAGANYTLSADAGKATLDVNASYSTKFFWDADNILAQKAYAIVSSSLLLEPAAYTGLSIRFWADNITKTKYYTFELPVAGGGGNIASPGSPRTYGAEVGVKF